MKDQRWCVSIVTLLYGLESSSSFHIPTVKIRKQTRNSSLPYHYHKKFHLKNDSPLYKSIRSTQMTQSSNFALSSSLVPLDFLGKIRSISISTRAIHSLLVLSSLFLLTGYHINLMLQERSSTNGSSKTWRQYQADTREDWSIYVRKTEGWLYAVQTLRNAITAQSFLASTVLSLLTLITGRMWEILRPLCSLSVSEASRAIRCERQLLTIQMMSIAFTMLLSAYNFLQGVRLMTHAGFMFPVKNCSTKVDKIMRQSQNCQWLGLRWMYLSLSPISWAIGGSLAVFVFSLILVQFFRSIDRRPEGMGYEEFQGGGI